MTVDSAGEQFAVRRRAPLAELTATAARRKLTESLIEARFLTTDRQEDTPIVGFAHEALLRRWERLATWINANRDSLRLRARVEDNKQRWEQQGRDPSLLLPTGLPLEEGRQLLAASPELLLPETKTFIRDSISHHEAKQLRSRRLRRSVMAMMSLLTLAAFIGGLLAWSKQREADAKEKESIASLARSNFFLADARWRERRIDEAFELLETIPNEHRNFEWRIARQLFEGSDVTLYGHKGNVSYVSFCPDGSQIASAGSDHTIKLWDAQSGAELRTLTGHSDAVTCVEYSSDASQLVSASDNTIALWDIQSGTVLRTLTGHDGPVNCVRFSPDGTRLASVGSIRKDNDPFADRAGEIKVWDTRTGAALHSLAGHSEEVVGVAFSPDGLRLASASQDNTIKLWNVLTGDETLTITGERMVFDVDFSPDGSLIASAGRAHTIKLWDSQSGSELRTLFGHLDDVLKVTFSPDGSRLASASKDKTIKLWDLRTGAELHAFIGHSASVKCVTFNADGSRLASASQDGTIRLWDARTGANAVTISSEIQIGPDETDLPASTSKKTTNWRDLQAFDELRTRKRHSLGIAEGEFSPDGKLFAAAGANNVINVWDRNTGKELHKLSGHLDRVERITFSPKGTLLASTSDHAIKLWNLHSGTELWTIPDLVVKSLVFSPDASLLAAGNSSSVTLWDVRTSLERRTIDGHSDEVLSVVFSPDGRRLASTSMDKSIKVWDTQTGGELCTVSGHAGEVASVAFSPDGTRLVAAGSIDTIKLWDAHSGTELFAFGRTMKSWENRLLVAFSQQYYPNRSYIGRLVFSQKGNQFESLDLDGLTFWNAPTSFEFRTVSGVLGMNVGLAFNGDHTLLCSEDGRGRKIAWDVTTCQQVTIPEEWPKYDSNSHRTSDGKWMALPFGNTVRLVDLKFKDNPNERAYRAFKARLDPCWHFAQGIEAEEAKPQPDWYSAMFHLSWLLKARPDDTDAYDRLHTAYDNWRKNVIVQSAGALAQANGQETAPTSPNPDSCLASIVREMLNRPRGSGSALRSRMVFGTVEDAVIRNPFIFMK